MSEFEAILLGTCIFGTLWVFGVVSGHEAGRKYERYCQKMKHDGQEASDD